MFQFSWYNQVFPIFIAQPQSFGLPLTSKQFPQNQTRRSPKKSHPSRTVCLKKSIDSNNKSFEMLKMGYAEGKTLTDPLSISINNNGRAGFGQQQRIVQHVVTAKTKKKSSSSVSSKSSVPLTKMEKRAIQIGIEYRDQIKLLSKYLENNSKENRSMITAQVTVVDEPICSEVFEIIHQYLVNSLHVYQGEPFPMFHDIAHVDDKIKIVCEDEVSFDYLSQCIAALSENLNIEMKTESSSPIGNSVYWFGVQIDGLVNGSHSFLSQIKKHRYELNPDCWIIFVQVPCQKTNKTNLQIIVDEYSAMVLIYRHYLRLFVCMQEIEFTLKGIIPLKG